MNGKSFRELDNVTDSHSLVFLVSEKILEVCGRHQRDYEREKFADVDCGRRVNPSPSSGSFPRRRGFTDDVPVLVRDG